MIQGRRKIVHEARTQKTTEVLNRVVDAICEAFNVPRWLIFSERGIQPVADARAAACLLSTESIEVSQLELGEFFHKHGSTVYIAARRAKALASQEPDFAAKLQKARELFKSTENIKQPGILVRRAEIREGKSLNKQ
jgi:chromosomal replication initiation ATPase DnaA